MRNNYQNKKHTLEKHLHEDGSTNNEQDENKDNYRFYEPLIENENKILHEFKGFHDGVNNNANLKFSKESDLLRREDNLSRQQAELENEAIRKEEKLKKELSEKESEFRFRENRLIKRQKEMEQNFTAQLEQYEAMRDNIQNELMRKERELQQLLVNTEREREKYQEDSRKALESKSRAFVTNALETLSKKEDGLKTKASIWSACGATSILIGIIFSILIMFYNAESFHDTTAKNLNYYLYMLFRGIIVIGLFITLSRHCFSLGNSFMHESLKISERTHAIKYGEFYLDVSGADAEWENIKEAFSNWNINGRSAFHETKENNTTTEQSAMELFRKALEDTISKSIKTNTKETH